MGAAGEKARSEWPDQRFWSRFDSLETRHQCAQSAHEQTRRELDLLARERSCELVQVWKRYCEVIAELDRSTAEIESFRSREVS